MAPGLMTTDYRDIFENAVAGIFQITKAGRFILANTALAQMLGFDSPDELIGERTNLSLQHYVEPARREEFMQLLETQGFVRGFEYEAYRKDGSKIWISENARCLRDEKGTILYYEGIAEDITNRNGTEHSMPKSNERYRSLAENFPNGCVLTYDRDLRITFAAGKGLAYSPHLVVGKLLHETVTPEVVAIAEPHFRVAFEGRTTTYEVPCSDGRAHLVTVTPLLELNGPTNEILVISQDITGRGQAADKLTELLYREQAIRYETEILRDANIALTQNLSLDTILETLLDYLSKLVPYDSANVMLRDGDSKFVVSALRLYEGFQDVEITRAIAFDGNANPLLRRICSTKQTLLIADTNDEPEWDRVPGAEHVRNWLGVPLVVSGNVIGLYSVDKTEPAFFSAEHARLAETLAARAASAIQNAQLFQQSQHYVAELEKRITERKQAEAALRASEERYRELFENAKDAIYVHDLKGTYTSINRAAELLSGYTREEILGHNFADLIAPEHISQVRDKVCPRLARKGETTYEVDVLAKDGRRVPVEGSSRTIYENGVAVGVQGTARDITERKLAQEALQMFPRQLIEAQEEDRRRIARELHDQIGQVLTAVQLNLHTVQDMCPTPEVSPYLKDTMNVVDEALRLVRDLTVDLRPPQLDDLGLVTALRWWVDRYAQRAEIRADVLVELADPDERFSRDLETACFRIAQEALTNVVRHAQAKRVSVELTRDNNDLLLAVKDDGVGFDLQALRKRASRAATLGLLGMQERAHAVGGTIEIDSTLSKGTALRCRFPIKAKR